jgi:transposase
MGRKNSRRYDPAFKARVALEAAREQESLAQIGQRHGVQPVLLGQWKKKLLPRLPNAGGGSRRHREVVPVLQPEAAAPVARQPDAYGGLHWGASTQEGSGMNERSEGAFGGRPTVRAQQQINKTSTA